MKMSQYNWSWWFVITLLVMLIGMMIAMVGKTEKEQSIASVIMVVGLISFIPCLYIGNKPTKN